MTKKRIILFALVISWMILIFWFSSAGHEVSSGQSERVARSVQYITNISFSEAVVRKAAHVFLYFVLGILLTLLVRTYRVRWRNVVVLRVCMQRLMKLTSYLLVGEADRWVMCCLIRRRHVSVR